MRQLIMGALAAITLASAATHAATETEVRAFLDDANRRLSKLSVASTRANWVFNNFITYDTQQLHMAADKAYNLEAMALSRQAASLLAGSKGLPAAQVRDLNLLRSITNLPSPAGDKAATELVGIRAELKSLYSRGRYCDDSGQCQVLRDMELRMANSRDPEELKQLWQGWRSISPPMRDLYARQVELANAGARDLGYRDQGDYWRSRYDMSGDAFAADMERYWQKTKPLYDALQCHVQAKLTDHYGAGVMPGNGLIPAHLTGNMWAQGWANIQELVMNGSGEPPYDLTAILEQRDMSAEDMVRMAEGYFVSLGLDPLPATFYQRSLFTRPADRDVVCHASAWDIDARDDIRIKMCIQRTEDEVRVIHHELGHNYYQRAYKDQSYLHRGSANPGFHEALGDAIALSVNTGYLYQIGMLDTMPATDEATELAGLMKLALDKVAFLPFALVVDKWRWQVFSGEVAPADYNKAWWTLREQYQGVTAPVARSEADFDPGAKYHIPGNTSYSRYFLAHLLQFQFHRRMCELAGFEGPLHQCTAYGSEAAGAALNTMMAAGKHRPWQDILEDFTGERDVDPQAMLDYFAPLKAWLDTQNADRDCGW